MIKSISRTLITYNLTALASLLLFFGIAFHLIVCEGLSSHFDWALKVRLDAIIRSPEFDSIISNNSKDQCDLNVKRFNRALELNRTRFPEDWCYLQIWNDQGDVIYRSPTVGKDVNLANVPDGFTERSTERFLRLPNGRDGRAIFMTFYVNEQPDKIPRVFETAAPNLQGERIMIVVARDAGDLFQGFRLMRFVLLTLGAIALKSIFLVTWAIARWSVKPMSNLAKEIEGLDESSPAVRLTSFVPVELDSLKTKLNEYLSRMEQSFERERQFSDDVAHELKTPLSGMRAQIDYAMDKRMSDDERDCWLHGIRDGVLQLDSLITRLLDVSRIDNGGYVPVLETVDINESLRFIWDSIPCSSPSNFQLVWKTHDHLVVETDLLMFSQAMGNVFDNAKSYVDSGGTIWIELTQTEYGARIEVSNSGCTLRNEDVAMAFSRLWRADKSRTNSARHVGLGLSIAQRLITTLNGTINASVSHGRFGVSIQIPLYDKAYGPT